jgi:hypothetical protein
MSASALIYSDKTKYQPIESSEPLEHYKNWYNYKSQKWESKNPDQNAHESDSFLSKLGSKVWTFFKETPAVAATVKGIFSDYPIINPSITPPDPEKGPVTIINHGFMVSPEGNEPWIKNFKKMTKGEVYNHDLGLYTLIAEKIEIIMKETIRPLLQAGHTNFNFLGHSEGCLVNYFLKKATEEEFEKIEKIRKANSKKDGIPFEKRELSFTIGNVAGVFGGSPMAYPLAKMPVPDSDLKLFTEAKKLKNAAKEITPGSQASKTASKIALKGDYVKDSLYIYSKNDELAIHPTALPPKGVEGAEVWEAKIGGHANLWRSKSLGKKIVKWFIDVGASIPVDAKVQLANQQG